MTRYEKILLISLAGTVALLTFGAAVAGLFSALVWLLAFSYLVAGYWLFGRSPVADSRSPSPELPGASRVLTGICLAIGLTYLLQAVHLYAYTLVLLLLVGGCGAGLLGYWLWLRRIGRPTAALVPLLVRVALVMGLGLMFTGRPTDYAALRPVLLVLNRGNDDLTHNILFHEYWKRAKADLDRDDGPAAFANVQRAIRAGNLWLGPDSVTSRYLIGGIYEQLYDVYRELGNAASRRHAYAEALQQYRRGDRILTTTILDTAQRPQIDPYWFEEPAWSLNHMAYCTQQLGRFEESDSLYLEAIAAYQRAQPKPTRDLAQLLANIAKSLSERLVADVSNRYYRQANHILAADTSGEATTRQQSNVLAIAANYLALDSLSLAESTLERLRPAPSDSDTYTVTQLTRAVILLKRSRHRESNRLIRTCLPYFLAPTRQLKNGPTTCFILLAINNLALGAYPQAQAIADSARALIGQQIGTASAEYGQILAINGTIRQALGDYPTAEQSYARALAIYQTPGISTLQLPDLLNEQASLLTRLGRYLEAHNALDTAWPLLKHPAGTFTPSQTSLLLTAANLRLATGQFRPAEARYRQVIAIHQQYGQAQSVGCAVALNGLLQIATAQHRLILADSLLTAGLALRAALLPERHPLTIALCVNGSELRLIQHRIADAADLLRQAQKIASALLPPAHDTFGDIAMAEGNVARANHQSPEARALYQCAYTVYHRKFGPNHPKAILARQRQAQ